MVDYERIVKYIYNHYNIKVPKRFFGQIIIYYLLIIIILPIFRYTCVTFLCWT